MPKLKFVFKIYIIGLFASMIATILPIVALALPEWGTVHTKDVQGNIGLFRYCCKICDGEEVCGDPADVVRDRLVHHVFFHGADDGKRVHDLMGCRAMVIIGLCFIIVSLVISSTISLILWCKLNYNERHVCIAGVVAGVAAIIGGILHVAAVFSYCAKMIPVDFTYHAGFVLDGIALIPACFAGILFIVAACKQYRAPENKTGDRNRGAQESGDPNGNRGADEPRDPKGNGDSHEMEALNK